MLSFILALIGGTSLQMETGRATIYFPCDGHSGTHKADGKPFRRKDHHIAHRWLPLGTYGTICNLRTRCCTKTVVRDRGPWGAIVNCSDFSKVSKSRFPVRRIGWGNKCWYWQVQIRLLPGWSRRADFDLTKSVARKLKHRAFDTIVFFYQDKKSQRTKRVALR